MSDCKNCGNPIGGLPFNCRRCNNHFCSSCRLPEVHNCSGLRKGNIFTNLSKPDRIQYRDDDSDSLSPEQYPPLTTQHTGNSRTPTRIKTHYKFSLNKIPDFLATFLICLLCAMFFANIVLPFVLLFIHSDMQFVFGNPKPLYFYDIGSSCSNSDSNIVSILEYLSDETGVRFVRLPTPFALIMGGISYECGGVLTNYRAVGEAESGMVGAGYFIFVWNNVKLLDMSKTTILHETLHVMGFDHSKNQDSIMHPSATSIVVETDLINFIRKTYVSNLWVYLNIIPLNLFYEFIIFGWIISLFKD